MTQYDIVQRQKDDEQGRPLYRVLVDLLNRNLSELDPEQCLDDVLYEEAWAFVAGRIQEGDTLTEQHLRRPPENLTYEQVQEIVAQMGNRT